MQDFNKLQIWELAKDLSIDIYKLTGKFPEEEKYGITSQLRRAANSIGANIAEGSGRNTNKDFAQFISVTIGSISEVENFIEISKELNYLSDVDYNYLIGKIGEIRRKSINFRKRLIT